MTVTKSGVRRGGAWAAAEVAATSTASATVTGASGIRARPAAHCAARAARRAGGAPCRNRSARAGATGIEGGRVVVFVLIAVSFLGGGRGMAGHPREGLRALAASRAAAAGGGGG